jgi:hypothetical protein
VKNLNTSVENNRPFNKKDKRTSVKTNRPFGKENP